MAGGSSAEAEGEGWIDTGIDRGIGVVVVEEEGRGGRVEGVWVDR